MGYAIMMRTELFTPKANLGIVVRGPMNSLIDFWESFEALCERHDLKIAFKRASASRLWVKEDDDNGESSE